MYGQLVEVLPSKKEKSVMKVEETEAVLSYLKEEINRFDSTLELRNSNDPAT